MSRKCNWYIEVHIIILITVSMVCADFGHSEREVRKFEAMWDRFICHM